MIPLETKVKDKITEFEGVVTARCEYFTGCVLYEVIPLELKDGLPQKEQWLDEQRLEILIEEAPEEAESHHLVMTNGGPGGPQNTPHPRSHPFEDD